MKTTNLGMFSGDDYDAAVDVVMQDGRDPITRITLIHPAKGDTIIELSPADFGNFCGMMQTAQRDIIKAIMAGMDR